MKVLVIFELPKIKDVNGADADFALDALSEDLESFGKNRGYDWHIEDVFGDDDDGT
jgi:hypothetical protein